MQRTTIDMNHHRQRIPDLGSTRANITAQGMAHQPKDWPEIERWLAALPPEVAAHATTAALMTWNLAARYDAHNEGTERQRAEGL